jgi:hypothetical protein
MHASLNCDRLMTQSGYFLVNLRSALEFVRTLDADTINMDPIIFQQKMIEAEMQLNGGFV